jgi:hypothetical protein
MRLLDYLCGGFALLALPVLVWWGIYQSPQSAVNLQARLEAAARAALADEEYLWADVRMNGQTAILTGNAPSEGSVQDAAASILRSSGPGGLIFGGVTQVERHTGWAAPVSPYVWQAEKTGEGLFILSGHVPSKAMRRRLVEEARLTGRSAVEDRMVLAAGAPNGNIEGIARLGIAELARLDRGRVEIRDHRVRLEGETDDPAVRQQVIATVSALAAPFRGEPLIGGASDWRAAHESGTLVLSGSIPGEAERRQILTLARQRFKGSVIDAMEPGSGPDEALMAGIAATLAHFTEFASGEMLYDRRRGAFTFTGEAPPSRIFFLKEDLARAPLRQRSVVAAEAQAGRILISAFSGGGDASCEAALKAVLAASPLGFVPATARFGHESGPALDALADAAPACPYPVVIEVGLAGGGHDAALDIARFNAISEYMTGAGFAVHGLTAITSDTGAPEGRVTDLRIKDRSSE